MQDIYQQVTDKILAQLESGVVPWVKPWQDAQPNGGRPYNAISGKPYRGINTALLFAPQFSSNAWMTFKQAKEIGANVRKGEKGSMIVFFKPWTVADKNDPEGKERTIPILRSFHVFNIEQIENLPAKFQPAKVDPKPEFERLQHAEMLLAQAIITHGGDRAFYRPSTDSITLPQPGQFNSQADYYAAALHELTHWTGHPSRCNREFGKRFGDTAYAREELVAEMGAAFLCGIVGIDAKLQHVAYLQSWIEVLKADKRAIVMAASAAQKAADYVTRQQEESAEELAA